MPNTKTLVPFSSTPEQMAALDAVIASYKGQLGATMPVLQEAQDIYGYLPIEVQRIIAEKMDVSIEEIYGIVSFYSQFVLNPKGEFSISVCLGTACYVKGAADILEEIVSVIGVPSGSTSSDGKYSLEATRCVGACGLAPVMIVNENVYGRVKKDQVAGILAKYK